MFLVHLTKDGTMILPSDLKPNDIIMVGDTLWVVTGDFIGANGHEDLVGLRPHTSKLPHAYGKQVAEYMVPRQLLALAADSDAFHLYPAARND